LYTSPPINKLTQIFGVYPGTTFLNLNACDSKIVVPNEVIIKTPLGNSGAWVYPQSKFAKNMVKSIKRQASL
jgi:hypothetical protein